VDSRAPVALKGQNGPTQGVDHLTAAAADESGGESSVSLYVVCILLIASTVSWRRGVYFSGSLDPVVLLKAATSGTALALAIRSLSRTRHRLPMGPRTIIFLTVILLGTCLGGWATGTGLASFVVAARVAILGAVMICLLQTYAADRVFRVMVKVMGATAVLGAVSGAAPSLAGYVAGSGVTGLAGNLIRFAGHLITGRLAGGIPPLSPNELALLGGVVVLASVWNVVEDKATRGDWAAIAGFLALVWLTGSRAGLVALTAAMVLMLLQSRRVTTPMFLGLFALLPAAVYLFFATSTVSSVFERGGTQNVTTLSSRTIAWDSALQLNISAWQQWFGGGMAMKQIPVSGQYWNQQILDSSWISALVQGGLVGLALVALWVVTIIVASFRCDRRWRSLWLGLMLFLVSRSFLESGLFDATPAFLLLMMVSLKSEKTARTKPPPGSVDVPIEDGQLLLHG
jgi:O-Antigen ligase